MKFTYEEAVKILDAIFTRDASRNNFDLSVFELARPILGDYELWATKSNYIEDRKVYKVKFQNCDEPILAAVKELQ